jgi:hypothetical protein
LNDNFAKELFLHKQKCRNLFMVPPCLRYPWFRVLRADRPPLSAAAELAAQKFVFVKSTQMHAAANRTFHQSCFSSNFASAMVMLLLLHTTASTTGHSNRNPPNSGLAYL